MIPLRSLRADNPGPFTLEGTRTFLVGASRVAIIDPGPALDPHLDALARAVAEARAVTVVVTHHHGDHAAGVDGLLERLEGDLAGRGSGVGDARGEAAGAPGSTRGREVQVVGAGHPRARRLADGDVLTTDAGDLVALHTPGHSADHLCLHWPARQTLFAADMVLGRGDTTWVGEYPGCVADYLASLDRLEALALEVIHPAHGPDLPDPAETWKRYRAHRLDRIAQVRAAAARVGPDPDAILDEVYGDRVPTGLRGAALGSVKALLEYLDGEDR